MATNKAFPPIIESRLPAQKGNTLSIPFQHSPAVSSEVSGINVKIKQITTNNIVATIDGIIDNSVAVFNIDAALNPLIVGQHYKAQLAYKDDQTYGYYSTVGVFKYTGEPSVAMYSNESRLETGKTSLIGETVIGKYTPPQGDSSEKEYSYCFNIYENNNILFSTGEQLHNYELEQDEFEFNYILNELLTYAIEYIVTTSNNMTVSTGKCYIWQGAEIPTLEQEYFTLEAISNHDSGSIEIKLNPVLNDAKKFSGNFRVLRYSNLDNFSTKEVISKFTMDMYIDTPLTLFTDYTVQQGVEYIYSIQKYSNNIYSQEIKIKESVLADFEDIFLFDGIRQLKVKFNPKVSSFKETILESKLDTIGGQYPFFFRNGRTRYKEIPLSGLISYWMDEDGTFIGLLRENEFRTTTNSLTAIRLLLSSDDNNLKDLNNLYLSANNGNQIKEEANVWSTNLTGDNFTKERKFKLEVLNWLNNGQPKLFRSPAEGNYIVRLMNVSLSPDEKLGRMLHTFNATAYEIAECNYSNLMSYNFVGAASQNASTWSFYSRYLTSEMVTSILPANWMRLYGLPGDTFILYFNGSKSITITIGNTGLYENTFEEPVIQVKANSSSNKIEYASKEIQDNGIVYKDKIVQNVRMEERLYSSTSGATIIADKKFNLIDENENALLENILSLKLEYIGPDNSESSFILNDTSIKLGSYTLGNVQTTGRIEYTINDFNGKFIPENLIVNENIRVDIYYRVIVIE